MVEQATHNRQATGSNPVGAIKFNKFRAFVASGQLPLVMVWGILAWVTGCLPACLAQELKPPSEPAGYTPQGLPASDPNVLRNFIPLQLNEFRYPDGRPVPSPPTLSIGKVSDQLYPGKPCLGCISVTVKVRNEGNATLIVDGENCKGLFAGTTLRAISEADLLKTSGSQFTRRQKKQLAEVAIATLGYAEPILQDKMTTSKTDWTVSYGTDEIRRKLESCRFGKRILLPGDEVEAAVYFQTGAKMPEKISIPIMSFPEQQTVGTLSASPLPAN